MREYQVAEADVKEAVSINLPKQKVNGHEINAWIDQDWGNELAFSPCELAAALGVAMLDKAADPNTMPGGTGSNRLN